MSGEVTLSYWTACKHQTTLIMPSAKEDKERSSTYRAAGKAAVQEMLIISLVISSYRKSPSGIYVWVTYLVTLISVSDKT